MAQRFDFHDQHSDQNLGLMAVYLTEGAAVSAFALKGKEDKQAADEAATGYIREHINRMFICGTVMNSEGEMDEVGQKGMLEVGEKVGRYFPDDPIVEVALDAVDFTDACARGARGAVSVMAFAQEGGLLHVPDMYMHKLAAGVPPGIMDITRPIAWNLTRIAETLGMRVKDLNVAVLNRPKHAGIIADVSAAGANVITFPGGDLMMALATARPDTNIHAYIGEGGAPEGVLAAAGMRGLGGDLQGILRPEREEDPAKCAALIARAERMMGCSVRQPLRITDMAKGNVAFAATGITDGDLVRGVRILPNGKTVTHSIVVRSLTGTFQTIEREHPVGFLAK